MDALSSCAFPLQERHGGQENIDTVTPFEGRSTQKAWCIAGLLQAPDRFCGKNARPDEVDAFSSDFALLLENDAELFARYDEVGIAMLNKTLDSVTVVAGIDL
jgi:hypothetical protein